MDPHTSRHRLVKNPVKKFNSTLSMADLSHKHGEQNAAENPRKKTEKMPQVDEATKRFYDFQLRILEEQILQVQINLMAKQKLLLQVCPLKILASIKVFQI